MLKNNNQPAVRRISARSLKHNKVRNFFAILAVVLTTFMFTTVFSIGFSMAKNMELAMLRVQGTKTSITLPQPDKEQIKQIKSTKYLNAAGIRIPAGAMESGKTKISLIYYDKTEYEENFMPAVSDVEGSYPSGENEIMLSRAVLDALNIQQPVKNMEIILTSDSGKKTFVLSGWFTDYVYYDGYQGFVSKAYTESMGFTEERDGVLCLSVKPGRQDDFREELLWVNLRYGQEFEIDYGDVQEENGDNALVIGGTIGLIGLIIVLSGYLLIYNVMYISVTKDIRFYGLLKTIGTSPSQIKKIVKMQTARFSLYGIPVGILLGALTSFAIVPFTLRLLQNSAYGDAMSGDISFNPFIYIGTILFAVITVAVSSRKPAKLASKVSAVEALKYNGQNAVRVRSKKSTDGGKIYKMAFRNVFREKKRALLVFASLFMGTMAFLSIDTFVGSMKLENYINSYLPNDYTIYTNAATEKQQKAAERLAEKLSKIDGVTDVSVNYDMNAELQFDKELFRPFLENKETFRYDDNFMDTNPSVQDAIDFYQKHAGGEEAYSASVIAVSSRMMEKYNDYARQKVDIGRFERGEICLIGDVQTKGQAEKLLGKEITLINSSDKKSVTIEIGSCMVQGEDYGININYYWQTAGAPRCILVSDKVMNNLCEKPLVSNIIANCEQDKESHVTAEFKKMVMRKKYIIHTKIKSEMIAQFKTSMMTINIMGAGISIVLLLIGALNFINVMLTGVYTRRAELAVMESIGMTGKQVRRMLVYEGLYYGVVTMALILSVGNAIIYVIADFAREIADYAVFHYPVALMCVIAAGIMAICMVVPAVVYRMLSKESVTQRLRNHS